VYPDVPQSELFVHSTLPHWPLEHACPDVQVVFNLADVEFEHFALTVPGFEHV